MEFQAGDVVYYVNPFIFNIDKVLISFPKEENGHQYYVETQGAILPEWDLFYELPDAKAHALQLLQKFYDETQMRIWNANPQFYVDPED